MHLFQYSFKGLGDVEEVYKDLYFLRSAVILDITCSLAYIDGTWYLQVGIPSFSLTVVPAS